MKNETLPSASLLAILLSAIPLAHAANPIVMAGSGGGAFKGGRYVKTKAAPLTNLFLSMADRMGAQGIEKHGDSTGRLEIV